MKTLEDHIQKDKKILDNPQTSPQTRRHIEGELHELEEYVQHHKKILKQEIIMTLLLLNFTVIRTLQNQNV